MFSLINSYFLLLLSLIDIVWSPMYLLCSHVERMLNLAGANQIFNEFQIMESVNIQPIFLKLVN